MDYTYKILNKFRPTAKNPPILDVRGTNHVSRAGIYSSFGNHLAKELPSELDFLTQVGKKGCTYFENNKRERKLFTINHDLGELIDSFSITADLISMRETPILLSRTRMIDILRNYGKLLGKPHK